GKPDDAFWGHGFLVPQAEPVVVRVRFVAVGQLRAVPVSDIEEVTQHLDRIALLPLSEQFGDGHAKVLSEEIEQRGLKRRYRVNGDAQIKCLLSSPSAIAIGKAAADAVQCAFIRTDRLSDDELARVIERLADFFAARNLADPSIAGAVFQDNDVARKKGAVRATKVHQHAVVAGDRNYPHLRNNRRLTQVARFAE